MDHTKQLDKLIGTPVSVLSGHSRVSGVLAKKANYSVCVRNSKNGNDAFVSFWAEDVHSVLGRTISLK